MFLTAVILILFFSLSDLAKWMNQNGATDKQKLFVFGGIFVLIGYLCPERVYKSGKTVYAGLFRYRVQK